MTEPKRMLSDTDVNLVSLVNKAANKQKFQIFKSEEPIVPEAQPTGGGLLGALKDLVQKFTGTANTDPEKTEPKVEENIMKAISFAQAIGQRQIKDEYWDMWYTLDDVLWGILFREPDEGQVALTNEQKAVAVAQSIDEFKSALVGLISTVPVTKFAEIQKSAEEVRTNAGGSLEVLLKAGRKISAKRLETMQQMHDMLGELIQEASATDANISNEEATVVKQEDIQKMVESAVQKAFEPVTAKLAELEKAEAKEEPKVEDVAKSENTFDEAKLTEIVKSAIEGAVAPISQRLEAVEKARGISLGNEGQEEIKKSAGSFGGAFL